MQRLVLALFSVLVAVGIWCGGPCLALAAPIKSASGWEVTDTQGQDRDGPEETGGGPHTGSSQGGRSPASPENAVRKQYEAEVKTYQAALKAYNVAMERRNICLGTQPAPARCGNPTRPGDLATPVDLATGLSIAVPALTGEQVAYIAFARLKLTPPTPMITPSPDRNRWKMAVVGYPLWLSVAGNTHPPAVNDAVGTANVSLEARVDHVDFSMGDQHSVSCREVSMRWNPSIEAGKKSPSCGYVYEKPSLPKGNYTVTATTYWSVAWATSTENGVIDFVQSDSTQLPVGELQVLVR